MMRWVVLLLLPILGLAGCDEPERAALPPPPAALTRDAIGHYCQMIVLDHPGPKGQAFVVGRQELYWFSSARDAIAFTMLPEETEEIRALYVSDMARAQQWAQPDVWVEAREAVYVIGSNRRGGMGQREAVPFSSRDAAQVFAREHGGRVVPFAEIPQDYILGSDDEPPPAMPGHMPEHSMQDSMGDAR